MHSSSATTRTEDLIIRSYDVDFRKRATAEALCRYFLEAAWNHAEALGVGHSHLARQNRVWVLGRLLIKFDGCLSWGMSARLHTWPRATKSALAMREFEIVDPAGNQVVGGSSAWLVLDAKTRKPQRIDSLLSHITVFPERMAIRQEPSKLAAAKHASSKLTVTARYSDIDVNEHVNSARYIAWIVDSYPLEHHQHHELKLIELNYLGETRGGSAISICSEESAPGEWSHSLVRPDGAEVCRARARWSSTTGVRPSSDAGIPD